MSTATTTNLFWGHGEADHRLEVVEGRWPDDAVGDVFVIGPDKRRPGGHWFDQQGLLARIRMVPDAEGRVAVRHRRLVTPLDRVRRRLPRLFRTVAMVELSPFGLSNLANTNVCGQAERLFVGYDAGRPLEVDPESLRVLTPVGAVDEWMVALPGLLEPGISVAAHPAPDPESGLLWFVNSSPLPGDGEVRLAAWDLEGPIRSWRVEGVGPFDAIHDVKATRNHLVFCDLPFVVEPPALLGRRPRVRPAGDTTRVWIVSRAELEATPPGGTVGCREVVVDLPTGHLSVDFEERDGLLRLHLEHIPLQDLTLGIGPRSRRIDTGAAMDPDLSGMVPLSVQPGALGRYLVDPRQGRVLESEVVWDAGFWGAVLATQDEARPEARARRGRLWYASLGYDPALVPTEWRDLYAGAGRRGLVEPTALPDEPIPAALVTIDREAMTVTDRHTMPPGSFAHPPTFVPRRGSDVPDDGYIVAVVHRDGPKEVWVFDAADLGAGPLARATDPGFRPPLLLHSTWMPPRPGDRPGTYRVGRRRDLAGVARTTIPSIRRVARAGRAAAREARAGAQ